MALNLQHCAGVMQHVALLFAGFSGNYLHLDAGAHIQRKRARLLSPEVGPEQGPLCLVFYYQLQGEAQGSLRVLLRDSEQEETLLWALKGDQGSHWREGRTILPQSPKEYQVSSPAKCSCVTLQSNILITHLCFVSSFRWCLRDFLIIQPEVTSE